jgi:hypothetical protein
MDLEHQQVLRIQRYAEGVTSGLWILTLVILWTRIVLAATQTAFRDVTWFDQVLYVVMLISLAVHLFILIVRAVRINRETAWERAHKIKRWAFLSGIGLVLLLGTLATLFARIAQDIAYS